MEPQNTQNTQNKAFLIEHEGDARSGKTMEPQNTQNKAFLLQEEGYAILGAVFEVYTEMGNGFLEGVYQECLEKEMGFRSIPFTPQPVLAIAYKGGNLRQIYQPDLICYEQIVLELKAVSQLAPEHRAQLHNYLKATGFPVGYLINFGHFPKVEFERVVRTRTKRQNAQEKEEGS